MELTDQIQMGEKDKMTFENPRITLPTTGIISTIIGTGLLAATIAGGVCYDKGLARGRLEVAQDTTSMIQTARAQFKRDIVELEGKSDEESTYARGEALGLREAVATLSIIENDLRKYIPQNIGAPSQ